MDAGLGISVDDMVNRIISENSSGLFFFKYNSGSEGIPNVGESGTMQLELYSADYYSLTAYPFSNSRIYRKGKSTSWGTFYSTS